MWRKILGLALIYLLSNSVILINLHFWSKYFFYSKLRAWISWFPNTFPTCKFVYARNSGTRAWEIAQWLREVTTLSRDWSSVPRTQVWAHRYLQYIFNWSDAHSEYLWHLHIWTHIHMHTWTCAHTYKMQFFQKNVNN